MIKESVSPQDVIDLLNQAFKLDPQAIEKLFAVRVQCNESLAEHPTIQVRDYGPDSPNVGVIGLLNGIFGVDDEESGIIGSIYDDNELQGFKLKT